jgi:hypothetical protein
VAADRAIDNRFHLVGFDGRVQTNQMKTDLNKGKVSAVCEVTGRKPRGVLAVARQLAREQFGGYQVNLFRIGATAP